MSWPGRFVTALAVNARATVIYVQPVCTDSGFGDPTYAIDSIGGAVSGLRVDQSARIDLLRPVGQSVLPRTWGVTLGGFNFRVLGDPAAFLRGVPLGTVLSLHVGFDNYDDTGLVHVDTGTVTGIDAVYERGSGQMPCFVGLEVTVVALPRALQGRLVNSGGAHPLFYNVGSTTTLTADSAVADGTWDVADTSTFLKRVGGSFPYGCISVATSAGAAFYRIWNASTATTFTIQDAATAGVMGTTDIGASTGDTVTECWYLRGNPLDIVRQVLTSRTGNAANGEYDILPEGWGIGLAHQLVDNNDISSQYHSHQLTPGAGTYRWELAGSDPIEDPWGWLAGWLAAAGYIICVRQGLLTCRAAFDTHGLRIDSGIRIDDNDIVDIDGSSLWDTMNRVEYYQCVVQTATGSQSVSRTHIASLPAGAAYTYDVSDRQWGNNTVVAAMDAARLVESVASIPERVRILCGGLRLAVLTLLDLVTLNTRLIPTKRDGLAGCVERSALVVGHTVDWTGGTVRLELLLYPGGDDA